jgi:predicted secreted hydrolase
MSGPWGRRLGVVVSALAIAACSGAPILALPPAARPTSAPATPAPDRPADPLPVVLPRDDGPHDRLTEWWYYTGHLRDTTGGRWGFEFVVFRAERGSLPESWASHLAITDEDGGRFHYGQRSEIGVQADRSPAGPGGPRGFDLAVSGNGVASPSSRWPWSMRGANGTDVLAATLDDGTGLALELRTDRAPALHDRDGWIDFGPAGGSYYYSRTRMDARGSLDVAGRTLPVDGIAWFDHQWGDFIAVGGGGWDWFAVNLEDGTDITLSLVRDRDGGYPLVYGTLVDGGGARHLEASAFRVEATDHWTSPASGATYPAAWRIDVPGEDLRIDLRPTVAGQELDTRASTGVVYWEGSQRVAATRDGRPLRGEAYVELTGYAG